MGKTENMFLRTASYTLTQTVSFFQTSILYIVSPFFNLQIEKLNNEDFGMSLKNATTLVI